MPRKSSWKTCRPDLAAFMIFCSSKNQFQTKWGKKSSFFFFFFVKNSWNFKPRLCFGEIILTWKLYREWERKRKKKIKKGISGCLKGDWDKVPDVVTHFLGVELKIGQKRAKMCWIRIKQEGMKGLGRWKNLPVGAKGRGGEGRAGLEGRGSSCRDEILQKFRILLSIPAFSFPPFTCNPNPLEKQRFFLWECAVIHGWTLWSLCGNVH